LTQTREFLPILEREPGKAELYTAELLYITALP
jgi:hypothetical protein